MSDLLFKLQLHTETQLNFKETLVTDCIVGTLLVIIICIMFIYVRTENANVFFIYLFVVYLLVVVFTESIIFSDNREQRSTSYYISSVALYFAFYLLIE